MAGKISKKYILVFLLMKPLQGRHKYMGIFSRILRGQGVCQMSFLARVTADMTAYSTRNPAPTAYPLKSPIAL